MSTTSKPQQKELLPRESSISPEQTQKKSPNIKDPDDSSQYQKKIQTLKKQNSNYRQQLKEVNNTLNKLIHNFKLKKPPLETLENQLNSVKLEIQNREKSIAIYKKQLKKLNNKEEAIKSFDVLAESRFQIQQKQLHLQGLRQEVKTIQASNYALQQKLLKYSRAGRMKSVDSHIQMMHEYMNENQRLQKKLDKYTSSEKKKEQWLVQNRNSTSILKRRVSLLPEISQSKSKLTNMITKRNSTKSLVKLDKLEVEKDIYTKWHQKRKPRKQEKIDKEIQQAQTIYESLATKFTSVTNQIESMRQKLKGFKQRITIESIQKARNILSKQQEIRKNLKNSETNCDIRFRLERRDWVGNFSNLRFSDSRHIKQQTRLYRIVHNSLGFYQFYYYPVMNHQDKLVGKLPFDHYLLGQGKQTAFTVEYPDYIKSFKLKINPVTNIVIGMQAFSNLGLTAQFQEYIEVNEAPSQKQKSKSRTIQSVKNTQEDYTLFSFDIKQNQATTLMFGSYFAKYDEKKNLIKVNLEGLGVQIIEDYVQQII